MSGIDLLSNDHILLADEDGNKVIEYDMEGKKILEVDAPIATTATGLTNGHFLVASQRERVFEVDRTGKVVWEFKGAGSFWRARRR